MRGISTLPGRQQQSSNLKKRDRSLKAATAVALESLEDRVLMSTYYVSPSGSDGAAGTSSAPWQSLQMAADHAVAGDTVHVLAGTYNAGMNFFGKAGGTASAPIKFIADPGAIITHSAVSGTNASLAAINVESTGGWYVFQGFSINSDGSMQRAGIRIAGSSNVQILNNTVHAAFIGIFDSNGDNNLIQGNTCTNSTDQHGIYVSLNTHNTVIRGNTLYGNNWDGLHMNSLNGSPNDGALVENNVIYSNNLAGMDIEGVTNATFRNNLIYGNGKHGITIHNLDQANTPPATGDTFVNNTIAANDMFGVQMNAGGNTANTFFNNTFFSNSNTYGSIGISGSATGLVSDYNVVMNSFSTTLGTSQMSLASWQSTTGQDTHSIIADPATVFVNPGANDYHLRSGSPAIDRGTASLGGKSAATVDIAGNARPAGAGYDIGAYESGAASVTVPTAPSHLAATAASSSQINLSWADNSANETGFIVERATGTGTFAQVALVAAGATSYNDGGLAASTQYSYRVCATNSAGDSADTNVSTATTSAPVIVTVPTAPTNLSAAAASTSQVNLTWADNSANETGFIVERATSTGAFTQVAVAAAGATGYSDSGLSSSTQYSYRVCATNSAGDSADTNVASATTLAASTDWQNTSFANQTGTFTAQFDATPIANNEDSIVGLSNGPASAYTSLAAIVRFNTNGAIDVRNGADYMAGTTVAYAANTSYHFRMVVKLPAHTYDVYVTPQGGSEVLLAQGYAFRTEQSTVTSLNNWSQHAESGGASVASFAVSGAQPITLAFSGSNYSVNENGGSATITATRSGDTSTAVSVNYATSNGTATAGSDYSAASGTLSFAAGQINASFTVPILDDAIYEGNETVNLALSNPTGGALLGTATAALTIVENDAADTTAPACTSWSPASGASGVATGSNVTATFSEAIQPGTIAFILRDAANNTVAAAVSYDASTRIATLDPASALAAGVAYTATVSGARDLAGNVMSPVSWSFATATVQTTYKWTQTTAANFNAGTRSGTVVSNTYGGEVQLARVSDDFNGTALSSQQWSVTSTSGNGTAKVTVSNGILSVAKDQVRSTQTMANTGVEGRIAFGAGQYQHFGLATNLTSASDTWAIFSTMNTTGTLYARVNVNGTSQDVSLGALPTGYHTYRVQPVSGGVQFYVDGVLKTTVGMALPSTTALRVAMANYNASPVLRADWVRTTYPSSGTFVSSVFNAGRLANWGTANWTASLPSGTGITVEVSTGNTATPDGTWSAWTAVSNGGVMAAPAGQYLRYRITLSSTNGTATPVFNDITISWG